MQHLLLTAVLLTLLQSAACLPVWGTSLRAGATDGSARIVGGTAGAITEFPWQVSLLRWNGNKWYHSCGGSLYSNSWIITAAHCVDDLQVVSGYVRQFLVVAGSSTIASFRGTQVRYVSKVVVHRYWNRALIQNDIALLKLSSPVTVGRTARPVSLPTAPIAEHKRVYATGWGKTSSTDLTSSVTLQKVDLYIKPRTCVSTYGSFYNPPTMLCAWGPYRATCMGDSGGPLVQKRSYGYGTLYGIASWGRSSCRGPSVFTNVYNYVSWIKSNTR